MNYELLKETREVIEVIPSEFVEALYRNNTKYYGIAKERLKEIDMYE